MENNTSFSYKFEWKHKFDIFFFQHSCSILFQFIFSRSSYVNFDTLKQKFHPFKDWKQTLGSVLRRMLSGLTPRISTTADNAFSIGKQTCNCPVYPLLANPKLFKYAYIVYVFWSSKSKSFPVPFLNVHKNTKYKSSFNQSKYILIRKSWLCTFSWHDYFETYEIVQN